MSIFLFDTYTDTDGIDLSSHVSETGHSYTKHGLFTDTFTIQSNRVGKDANVNTTVYYSSAIPPTPDCRVTAPIVEIGININRAMGIGMRINTSADHGIYARRQTSTAWQLLTIVTGAVVQNLETITTVSSTGTSTLLSAWCVDDKLWWSLGGVVSPLSPHTITSAELLVNGRVGFRASNNHSGTGYHADSLTAESIVRRVYSLPLRPRIFAPGIAR